MNSRTRLTVAFLLTGSLVAGAAACSNKDSDTPTGPSGNTPRITEITPNVIQASTGPQLIVVKGEAFINGLTLEVNSPAGSSIALSGNDIQSVASNEFQANVTFDVPGNYTLRVRNPNGAQSTAFSILIGGSAGNAPQVTSISPTTVVRGTQAVLVVLQGNNLTNVSVITMTPPSGAGQPLGGNQIVSITATEIDLNIVLDVAGTYTFTVTNGQEASTPISLTVL